MANKFASAPVTHKTNPGALTKEKEIEFPFPLIRQLFRHARSSQKNEICGLISSQNGVPISCYPINNTSSMPQSRFQMDAQQQINAMRNMREANQDLFAIYHSHPNSEASPSERDLNEAAYDTVLHIIISINTKGDPELRGFRINKSREFMEVTLLPKSVTSLRHRAQALDSSAVKKIPS